MAGTPIVLTLYDPETDEPKKTFRRSFVPWKLLKEAIRIATIVRPQKGEDIEYTEEMVDQIAGLVISVFGNQFTLADLDDGADVTELIAVFNQIVAKAQGIQVNPPPAG